MRRALALGSLVLLAACGQKAGAPSNQEAVSEKVATGNSAAINAAGNAEANQSVAPSQNGPAPLPPANATLRFVGRWATSQANCASKPWVFTADRLTAIDGPHCTIYKVTSDAGGYDLAAECPAKVPDHTDLIKLRFAESAQAMLVESNVIEPMGLIYCGK